MFLKRIVLILMATLVFVLPWGAGAFGISIGPLGLMSILGILAFLFAVAYLLFGSQGLGRAAVPMDASVALLGVFVALNLASVGWADVPASALGAALMLIQMFVLVWLLAFLRLEKRGLDTILHAYVIGSIIVASWSAHALFVVGSDAGVVGRLDGFNRDANFLAYTLILAMPMAYYLATQRSIGVLRWVYFAFIPLTMVLVIFTQSRGMFVAMLTWFALLLWFVLTSKPSTGSWSSRAKVLLPAAVVVVVSGAVVIAISDLAESQIQRLMTVTNPTEDGFGYRWEIWMAGIQVFLQNMVLGVGAGGFPAAIIPYFEGDVFVFSFIDPDRSAASHNTYLNIAVTTGAVGLAIFGAIVWSLLRKANRADPPEKLLFMSLLFISLAAGLSLHLDNQQLFFVALFAQAAFPVRAWSQRERSSSSVAPSTVRGH